MTRLIIARHGNTFEKGETPTRVGKHTDLPLTTKGIAQGAAIGRYLKAHNMLPNIVYCSNLKRTIETAQAAMAAALHPCEILSEEIFDEIDYGPDENKPEDEVIARIGEDAIEAWNTECKVPDGWIVDPDKIIKDWQDFANAIYDTEETVLVVTSNGTARFAPRALGIDDTQLDLKLSTGAFGILEYKDKWIVQSWNIKP